MPLCGSKNTVIESQQVEYKMAASNGLTNPDWKKANSTYDFNYINIDGAVESMEKYRGHVLIVEPGTEAEIKEFIKKYNVEFDMASKINVNGDNAHPLWKYMKSKQGGLLASFIKWNFTKFIIDKEGRVVKRFGPHEDPLNMEPDLQKLFKK
ncbi:unnamed protein product [Allacma fusca]|uniref:Glutathione peroxidase n=1 Tax=Allacma fusca TaxID=39272 RepID=A0A8J2P878_9HEXA|nr:unnamed protein product [Allacma fusca]CAG7729737.1 unnamed protein product [Allacma fusca]